MQNTPLATRSCSGTQSAQICTSSRVCEATRHDITLRCCRQIFSPWRYHTNPKVMPTAPRNSATLHNMLRPNAAVHGGTEIRLYRKCKVQHCHHWPGRGWGQRFTHPEASRSYFGFHAHMNTWPCHATHHTYVRQKNKRKERVGEAKGEGDGDGPIRSAMCDEHVGKDGPQEPRGNLNLTCLDG